MNVLDQSLGHLARDIPGVTAVFYKYGLNFCCGGKQSLRAAASRHNLDLDVLLAELDVLRLSASAVRSWAKMPNFQLIEHIVNRYHEAHRRQLPELIRLARRVEHVHIGRSDCPLGLAYHLEHLYTELESHMQKEERILFPLIARELPPLAIIARMRREHDEHGEVLAVIDKLTGGITLPKGACNTWRALYMGLETLKTDLINHIHLENNVLFDRVDGQLEDIKRG